MVSLKPPKPGKFKGRGKNGILSVTTAACCGAAAQDGDVGLRSGSTEPGCLQWAQGKTLPSPCAELSMAKKYIYVLLSSVFSAKQHAMVTTEILRNSHVQ